MVAVGFARPGVFDIRRAGVVLAGVAGLARSLAFGRLVAGRFVFRGLVDYRIFGFAANAQDFE